MTLTETLTSVVNKIIECFCPKKSCVTSLTSTSTTDPLAANMGKALNDLITDKCSYTKITEQTVTDATADTVVTIASLSLEAGTYLVLGGAQFAAYGTFDDDYTNMICLSNSTTYNHNASTTALPGQYQATHISTYGIFELSSSGSIYLLGRRSVTGTINRGRIHAIKLS